MNQITRVELRTTNVAEATAYYDAVLGEARGEIVALPEAAVARGARPHWLGYIEVEDVERTSRAFVVRGATQLGPPTSGILKDTGGAIIGLSRPQKGRGDVAWYGLNTEDLAGAIKSYGELFGWSMTDELDMDSLGMLQNFAWSKGGPSVGSMLDATLRRGMHPHWLYQFRVPSIDKALAASRDRGGVLAVLVELPDGGRVAVCDDVQGTAYAMRE